MTAIARRSLLLAPLALAACGRGGPPPEPARRAHAGPAEINRLIARYAREYGVPEDLVHRVVVRESRYNPAARNGPYYGLMQIHPQTARTMGHRGPAEELLDPEVNLRFGVRYLRGAWLVARGNPDAAIGWYSRGYYYEAKRLGLLEETGLRG
ncbi:MAG: lytic transglycosylase domain-containing protein [Rhodobacteraceae bacterium]|nr:lytic transglycosylase domain-containing protein [Paracoccaceae bacterium]